MPPSARFEPAGGSKAEPVVLTVNIWIREEAKAITPAATGPKVKPPMQMITSFRSKSRKPSTLGMSLEV